MPPQVEEFLVQAGCRKLIFRPIANATMTKRGKPRRHISDQDLAAFLENRLQSEKQDEVIAHLAECTDCRQLVAAATMSRKFVHDPRAGSK